MNNTETDILRNVEMAPYLQMATALIGKSRRIGGNQFRHIWATVGILIDHKIIEPVILKAGALHDLKEDAPSQYFPDNIRKIDADGVRVVELVEELSIAENETKPDYLLRVMVKGSREAKIIKLADRISNLTDIQLGTFDIHQVQKTLDETNNYILPYARQINENMYLEMVDLIDTRTKYVHRTVETITQKTIEKAVETIHNTVSEIKIEISTQNDPTIIRHIIQNTLKKIHGELTSDWFVHNIYNNI